jgi:hypothetical protein
MKIRRGATIATYYVETPGLTQSRASLLFARVWPKLPHEREIWPGDGSDSSTPVFALFVRGCVY